MNHGMPRVPSRSTLRIVLLILPGSLVPLGIIRAQDAVAPGRKVLQASRVAADVRIDGRLNDPAWRDARFISDFFQREPVEGAPATTRTEVAIVYDDDALYIGARMHSLGPDDVSALMTRRDNGGNAERIVFSIDSYRDRRTAYTFGITATGVRVDYYQPSDQEHSRDYSWDPVWQARAAIDSTGWTAELRIPFSQLRFTDREVQVWGININRWIPTRTEDDYWIVVPNSQTGWASRFGDLVGIQGIKPTRRLELLPYAAAGSRLTGRPVPANPFDNGTNFSSRAGGDLKMGLGPNLTLDATINPDFGQVEADPAEVNLSAVETFFTERRPFFTEGANLLQGGGDNYFYSRRIGAPPRGDATADFVDQPAAATILGAAKLSGRLSSGTSVGVLAAVTDGETARTYDTASAAFGAVPVAPVAGYGVVRLQQEFGPSQSTVGMILTGVRREVTAGSSLASVFTRSAYTGGVDWNLRFGGGQYEVGGAAGFSYIDGDTAVIAAVQQAPAHYFQRPDADYLRFDPTRTSLGGYTASVYAARNGGAHWLYSANLSAQSPGFELNDAGRIGTADDIDLSASVRYRETFPGRLFRNYSTGLRLNAGWDFGGIRQLNGVTLDGSATLLNYLGLNLGADFYPGSLSDNATRGGPLMSQPLSWGLNGGVSNNFSANTRWQARLAWGRDDLGGWQYRISGSVTARPAASIELSLAPGYARSVTARQYITQLAGGPAATYGNRYVFGTVGRSTISAQFRLSYAISPELTLELYAEPFSASGQYYRIGELARPRTSDLRLYGTGGSTITRDSSKAFTVTDGADQFTLAPDFSVLSFRSNMVLRWEWRAGSTLFLVWQQNRSGSEDALARAGAGPFFRSLSAPGTNFLAVKVSYWLPVS